MIAVLQRVTEGGVQVDGDVVGGIGTGFVVLLGVGEGDGEAEATKLAEKTANLRVFDDDDGKLNLSALDVGGEMLVISQFTLLADCKKGRRPSFTKAAHPDTASPLVDFFVDELLRMGVKKVEKGVFGAMMQVEIHNDGPVTIILDTDKL